VSVPPGNEPPLRLKWEQINAVFAYKRDCYTVDQIRLILGDDVQLTRMEITEDNVGFKVLIVEIGAPPPITSPAAWNPHAKIVCIRA
jgi:hypothetical protein